jgi:hypothetical protein
MVSSSRRKFFFKSISPNFGDSHQPTIGFSVPVDATNLYVDYRLGNKVYVKLLNQYTDINYVVCALGYLC